MKTGKSANWNKYIVLNDSPSSELAVQNVFIAVPSVSDGDRLNRWYAGFYLKVPSVSDGDRPLSRRTRALHPAHHVSKMSKMVVKLKKVVLSGTLLSRSAGSGKSCESIMIKDSPMSECL